jgi:hypothetical protein
MSTQSVRRVTYILTTGYPEGERLATDNYHIVAYLHGPETPSLAVLERRFRAHFGVIPKNIDEAPDGEVDPTAYRTDLLAWEKRHNCDFEGAELDAGLSGVIAHLRAEGYDEVALERIARGRPTNLAHAFVCWLEREHGFIVSRPPEHNTLDLGHYCY